VTSATYVFRVTVGLEPTGVRAEPTTFETVVERPADPPGEPGWRFFRDRLWRGAVGDQRSMRAWASERLGAPVVAIEFGELRTDPAYLDALRDAIAAEPAAFGDAAPERALTNYLGSSIRVVDPGGDDAPGR
jgi:hypothetical protein